MAKRLDKLVVVDLESTCWRGPPPPGEESEIIEVGVCLLDPKTLVREERRSLLVRPQRSSVSAFCTELTALRPEDLAGAGTLADACAVLAGQYDGRRRAWASYGDYDRRQLERCCRVQGLRYPFGPTHLNVKALFALAAGLPHEVGLARALELSGLAFVGRPHRGVDDAWNVAALLAQLLARWQGAAPEANSGGA